MAQFINESWFKMHFYHSGRDGRDCLTHVVRYNPADFAQPLILEVINGG